MHFSIISEFQDTSEREKEVVGTSTRQKLKGTISKKAEFIKETLAAIGEIPKVKLQENLSEQEAFDIERAFIKAIGRFPKGTLTNLTDNGSGPNSEQVKIWHASRSDEERW